MTRTTDPEPGPWRPLGEKVTRPTPSKPSPKQKPVGPSGIVTDENGRMRTTTHQPGAPKS